MTYDQLMAQAQDAYQKKGYYGSAVDGRFGVILSQRQGRAAYWKSYQTRFYVDGKPTKKEDFLTAWRDEGRR